MKTWGYDGVSSNILLYKYFTAPHRTPAPTAPLRPHLRSSEFYKAPFFLLITFLTFFFEVWLL